MTCSALTAKATLKAVQARFDFIHTRIGAKK